MRPSPANVEPSQTPSLARQPSQRWRRFRPLAYRDYRLLWAGTCLYFLAFVIAMVSQSVIAYDLTGTNRSVGIVALCFGVSLTVGSPIGGVLADRFEPKRVLILSQLVLAFIFSLIALLFFIDALTLPLLAIAVFVTGSSSCAVLPARQAWSPAMLPAAEVPDGAGLQVLAVSLMGLVAPFIGGLVLALPFVDLGGVYLVLAAAMVGTTVLAIVTRATSQRSPDQTPPLQDLKLGLVHVLARPRLAVLMLSFYAVILAGSSYMVLLPGFLEDHLERQASDVTWLMTMSGAGGLVATGVLSLLPVARQSTLLLAAGGLILGIGLALVGSAASFDSAMACMFVVGVGIGSVQLLYTSVIMRESDPQYYGRVMSLVMLGWGINGMAALGIGLLADGMGAGRTLATMGAVAITVSATMWATLRTLQSRARTVSPANAQVPPAVSS